MKKIGKEEWEIRLPAQAEDIFHAKGEIQFSGGKGIVAYQVIGFHVKVAAKFADFSGIGDANPRIRIKKVAGVNKKNLLLFLAKLFDKGRPPGQTAKQEVSSAAGLHFTLDVCREGNGKGALRVGGRHLRPSRSGEQEDEQKYF